MQMYPTVTTAPVQGGDIVVIDECFEEGTHKMICRSCRGPGEDRL